MSIDDILKEMQEIRENPEVLDNLDSGLETVLKEIIKIERRHLYGTDSTGPSKRRKVIQELLIEKIKNKER